MADSGTLTKISNLIFYKLIIFVAVKTVVGTKPGNGTYFIFADGINSNWHCDCAEFSLTHFFNTTAVVGNPHVAFAVFKKMVDVVVGNSVTLVVISVHSVVQNCDSAVRGKPVVTGSVLNNRIYNSSLLMVMAYIKYSFFCVFNAYSVVRRNSKPEGTAFILTDLIYRRIFDFCDSGKSFYFTG